MLMVMTGCGAFLFVLMSSTQPKFRLVQKVGLGGAVAGVVSMLSEAYTVTKEVGQEQQRKEIRKSLGLQNKKATTVAVSTTLKTQQHVDGCSLWLTVTNFIVTSSYTGEGELRSSCETVRRKVF